ncbi:hypothetical protein QZP99_10640 [Serratia marcescens]|uniref:hypothetical protein n=1 Tax=Serratia marcescens TaxID=615 RepID=UPI00275E1536|nr:hypothetical protein [Serratia marcescens]MDP8704268.1 hypothetical protein [Serratia marcescens]
MVQRYNPDYVMHAARFAPFAREAEHGEFVKFSDYEVLKAERDALAVENAALNKSLDDVCDAYENGQRDLLSEAIDKAINLPSPATDAALAAIQAQGVEKFADDLHKTAMAMCSVKPDNTTPGAYARLARSFAKKLREAK